MRLFLSCFLFLRALLFLIFLPLLAFSTSILSGLSSASSNPIPSSSSSASSSCLSTSLLSYLSYFFCYSFLSLDLRQSLYLFLIDLLFFLDINNIKFIKPRSSDKQTKSDYVLIGYLYLWLNCRIRSWTFVFCLKYYLVDLFLDLLFGKKLLHDLFLLVIAKLFSFGGWHFLSFSFFLH